MSTVYEMPRLAAVAAAAAVSAAAFAGASRAPAPGTGDYVRQGDLFLHYDGIRNAGSGAAHSANAVKWANLGAGGAEYDLSKHLNLDVEPTSSVDPRYGAWTEDGYRFGGSHTNTSMFAYTNSFAIPATYTIQVLLDAKPGDQVNENGGPASSWVFAYQGYDQTANYDTYRHGSILMLSCGWSPPGAVWQRAITNSLQFLAEDTGLGSSRPSLAPERETGIGWFHKEGNANVTDRNGSLYGDVPFKYVTAMMNGYNDAVVFAGCEPPWTATAHFATGHAKGSTAAKSLVAPDGFRLGYGTTTSAGAVTATNQSLKGTIKNFRMYKDRVLTNAELQWNRMVDEARFFGGASLANANVIVAAAPSTLNGQDFCGSWAVDSEGHSFTAPAVARHGGVAYKRVGLSVETWSDETGWGEPVESDASVFEATSATKARVTWRYDEVDVGYGVGDYVQDGLILQYDGIRNQGADMPHDGAADTWVNIAPGGGFTLSRSGAEGDMNFWLGDGYFFGDSSVQFVYNDSTAVVIPKEYTMEILVDAQSAEQSASQTYVYTNDNYQATASDPDNRGFSLAGDEFIGYVFRNVSNWKYGSVGIRGDQSSARHSLFLMSDGWNGAGYSNRARFQNPSDTATSSKNAFAGTSFTYATVVQSNAVSMCFCGTEKPAANAPASGAGRYSGTEPTVAATAVKSFSIGGIAGSAVSHLRGTVKSIRLYGRVLTDEELAANRVVDDERFFGIVSRTNAVISSFPPSVAGIEPNGTYRVSGDSYTFSSGETATDRLGIEYRCVGHTLETWSGAIGWWGAPVSNAATSRAVSKDEKVRITWLWEAVKGIRSPQDYDVMDYVQDGLVLNYDGIRNIAADRPHSSNSVVWRNLAGSSHMMRRMAYAGENLGRWVYSDGESGGRWSADGTGFDFDCNGYFAARERFSYPAAPRLTVQVYGEFGGLNQRGQPSGEDAHGYVFATPNGNWRLGSLGIRKIESGSAKPDPAMYYVSEGFIGSTVRPSVSGYEFSAFNAVLDGSRATAFAGTALPTDGAAWVGGHETNATAISHISIGGVHHATAIGSSPAECVVGKLQSFRVYGRVLTDAELAWNRMLDETRFGGRLPVTNVVVAAAQYDAAAQTEAAGPYKVEGSWTFTAKDTYDEGRLRRLVGYSLETWNGEAWTSKRNYAGGEYEYVVGSAPALVRLTWRWQKPPTYMIFR